MTIHEIPRQEWETFFDRFSRQHVNEQVPADGTRTTVTTVSA